MISAIIAVVIDDAQHPPRLQNAFDDRQQHLSLLWRAIVYVMKIEGRNGDIDRTRHDTKVRKLPVEAPNVRQSAA